MRRLFLSNFIKGFACLAIALFAMANKPCFADNRLTIGSFNGNGDRVQLVINNVDAPYYSALATAVNQTFSNFSDDVTYHYLNGTNFLDYVSYLGLYEFLSDSSLDFYNNGLFVNVYGAFRESDQRVFLCFSVSKDNFVRQPVEWYTNTSTGDQEFYEDTLYFSYNLTPAGYVFAPYYDNIFGLSTFDSTSYYLWCRTRPSYNVSYTYDYRHYSTTISSQPFFYNGNISVSSSYDYSSILNTFYNNSNYHFLNLVYDFSLSDYQNDVSAKLYYAYNWLGENMSATHPLASSFVTYSVNTEAFTRMSKSDEGLAPNRYRYIQFSHNLDSLASAFLFNTYSGALAYQDDFVVNPTPTPTPFPTFEPWDPNNPAGGSTPTPIPSGFGGLTPSPVPSVSPPVATVTPINIFYNPEISNAGDVWGYVKSIFDDFNSFFLDNQFIRFASSIMNTIYYFDPRFKYFVIPVFVCFIVFIMGRFRRK